MSRVSIPQLVVALEDGAPLRDALASALGDDELAVLYWLERRQGTSRAGWVDPQGHAAPEPAPEAGRAVKLVEHDGARIAAIEYDAALDDESELLDAVTAAVGLALRNDRLQAELRAEVAFWDTVTNTVPSLLATIDTDGVIRNLNAAAVEVAGYDEKDDVVGRDYWDVFIDPSERADVVARFAALAPGFPAGEYENTFVNARGERRVVFWRTAPVHDENGDVIAIVSGGADITMRRRRELELERERDVQTTVFESMPSIMVALAADGTIRDRDADNPSVGANRAFRQAIRWPDERARRTPVRRPPRRGRRRPRGARDRRGRGRAGCRTRSSPSSSRRTEARASSCGRRSRSPTSPAGWTGSSSSAARTSRSASGSRSRTSSSVRS